MNNTLDKLSTLTNRSYSQTEFLCRLCNNDLKKLVLLEQKILNNFLSYCPGDKEAVEDVLSMSDGSGWAFSDERYSKLDDFLDVEDKIGKECTFKETGHKGMIKYELPWNKRFLAQWGIFWNDGKNGNEHAERNRTIGVLNFWQDKDKIDFKR